MMSYSSGATDEGSHGIELFKTDGTEDGTVLVKDILVYGVVGISV